MVRIVKWRRVRVTLIRRRVKRKKVERVEVIKGMAENGIGFQGGFLVHLIQLRGLFHF